jgi:hypothetical protein
MRAAVRWTHLFAVKKQSLLLLFLLFGVKEGSSSLREIIIIIIIIIVIIIITLLLGMHFSNLLTVVPNILNFVGSVSLQAFDNPTYVGGSASTVVCRN